MKKSNRQSFQKTLAFAATVAALGASLGVPSSALGITLIEAPATGKGAQASGPNAGVVQQKADRKGQKAGANQKKESIGGAGANQMKFKKAKANALGGAGSNNMLNPQPLPPKQQNLSGQQLPAVQK